jgi:hypothetical protein
MAEGTSCLPACLPTSENRGEKMNALFTEFIPCVYCTVVVRGIFRFQSDEYWNVEIKKIQKQGAS